MTSDASAAGRVGPRFLLRPRLLGLVNTWKGGTRAEKWTYAFFIGVGALFWVGLFVGLYIGLDAFRSVEVFGPLITRKLLELLLLSLFGMLLFSNVVTALSAFYLSDDLELLLSMPIRRDVFYYTRALDTLGQSSWMMAFFGVPLFVDYGLVCDASWRYYALLPVVMGAYLAIPAAIGAVVSSILVTFFPAHRTREALVIIGLMFLMAVLILVRILEPERLVNAQDFDSLAAYVAELQAPTPALFPPRWAVEVLEAAVTERPLPWLQLGLLVSGAFAALGASRWVTMRLFADGWTRSQEAREARFARAGLFDRLLSLVTRPLPRPYAALVIKDVKIFVRDPAQWSQAFLLVSLIVIYLFSVRSLPVDVVRGPYMQSFKDGLAFMNLGAAGFVMAGIAARFQFAVVSGEGRVFWLIRSAPLNATRFLFTKGIPGMVPMLIVGETLIVASNLLLESPPALTAVGAFAALCFAFGISGIAMGVGAAFPDFKVDNIARAAAGPAAMLFMVAALVYVLVVITLLGFPVFLLLRAELRETALTAFELGVTGGAFAAVLALSVTATLLPIRLAAKGLWERTL